MKLLKPGWHIDNYERLPNRASFRYPNSREEQDFLPDQDGNELRVGDRVEFRGGAAHRGEQAWVIALDVEFVMDDGDELRRAPKEKDEISMTSGVRVRTDAGLETGYRIAYVRKVELSEVERAEIREEQLRRAIRDTEDVIADYEAHLRGLLRRREENAGLLVV
jgi:hypothetical protein